MGLLDPPHDGRNADSQVKTGMRQEAYEGAPSHLSDGAPSYASWRLAGCLFADEPPMLDPRTAIHDHGDAGRARPCSSLLVDDIDLHPDRLNTLRDRVVDYGTDLIGPAKHVDQIDRIRD